MTADEILSVFRLKRIRQADLARKFQVSHVMIHQVIHGRSKSHRIQEEIARIVEKEIEDIWPSSIA